MKTVSSGKGPWLVYFQAEDDRGEMYAFELRRPTRAAARTEALTQAKLRGVYVSVMLNSATRDRVRPPDRASWLIEDAAMPESRQYQAHRKNPTGVIPLFGEYSLRVNEDHRGRGYRWEVIKGRSINAVLDGFSLSQDAAHDAALAALEEYLNHGYDPGHDRITARTRSHVSNPRRNPEGSVEPGDIVEFVSVAPTTAPEMARTFQMDTLELQSILDELEAEDFVRRTHGGAYMSMQHYQANGEYYVWLLDPHTKQPLTKEGPYGPYARRDAMTYARIGATRGKHPRAVSKGVQPDAKNFSIIRVYS